MRRGTGAALGILTMVATAALSTAGTAAADSRVGKADRDGRPGRVIQLGLPGKLVFAEHPGRHGRGVGAADDRKHSASSAASHNWGGGNWNSKVVFGDMILD
ncbi:hypothetical protein ACH4FX_07155 [Streptomyces sp. NPDC018019]|uniref:hypothetical protein n=1 Tax=Streptomyces sp. NPDC018019 TaxID=3365030 RepID=UPI00379418EA